MDLPYITDLTGLEHAARLRILALSHHNITDLDPLAQLTELRELDITKTDVIDLTPLAQLTQLRKLDISTTNVIDLTPLAQLTQLKELSISNTRVIDLTPLAHLTQLSKLDMWDTHIIDLTPLAHLTQLSKLDMWDTHIIDLTPLAHLTRLTEIRLTAYTTIAASDIQLLAASTPQPLTEATLNGSSAILTLLPSGAYYDKSIDNLRNALTVSGIPGVIVSDVTRLNDTQVKVTLEFTGNLSLPDTLTFTISPEAVSGYEGRVLTAKITIYAPLELSASPNTLTDVRLDGAIVTLTLASGAFHSDKLFIRNALTISGIPGIDIASWSEIERVSNREIQIKLTFKGNNITTDSILTLTVGPGAIANYNGPARTLQIPVTTATTQVPVTGGKESVVASTAAPLTEATLHESVVTLSLTGSEYVRSISDIRDAVTVSGITGVTIPGHEPDRKSYTQITITLDFDGNINTDSTLTFTVGADAIAGYNGPALITQVPVTGDTESVVASTVAPLTEATLHESVVTLSLTGRKYVRSISDIRDAVTVSGITGVTMPGHEPDRKSDTQITVELDFDGNINTDSTLTFTVGADAIAGYNGPALTAQVSVSAEDEPVVTDSQTPEPLEDDTPMPTTDTRIAFEINTPAGISLIHIPLKVTAADGVAKTITSIADLYDVLGSAGTVNFLITYDSQAQEWRSYFGASDTGTPADKILTDDTGIIAGMRAPVSVRLSGNPLGTNGSSFITLSQGLNLVGLPLRDSRITRVSDLLTLDGIGGNVPVIILTDNGEFKAVGRADDPGNIEITGGQSFILTAQRAVTIGISGDGWTNTSGTATAPLVAMGGIEVSDVTPILALRGSIVDEDRELNNTNFRVIVKNHSTGKSAATVTRGEYPSSTDEWGSDGVGYQLTDVDLEMERAAMIGDILEISAQSLHPLIGVESLEYTVTTEDVRQSWIQLPALVAYEIPAETALLHNYPNPFNPETWIPYRLAEDAFVTLTIYDLSGQVVRTLDIGHRIAAVYESQSKAVYWDGRNNVGEQVASGVYFYHLMAGDYSATRKMLILK